VKVEVELRSSDRRERSEKRRRGTEGIKKEEVGVSQKR
jgi:hypothetical protein